MKKFHELEKKMSPDAIRRSNELAKRYVADGTGIPKDPNKGASCSTAHRDLLAELEDARREATGYAIALDNERLRTMRLYIHPLTPEDLVVKKATVLCQEIYPNFQVYA